MTFSSIRNPAGMILAFFFLAVGVAACGDSTGPGETLDEATAQKIASNVDSATASLEESPGIEGLNSVMGAPPLANRSLPEIALTLEPTTAALRDGDAPWPAGVLPTPSEASDLFESVAANAIPTEFWGKVYVYDSTDGWVEDTGRSVSFDGVRFVLYAVNDGVIDNSTEKGYIDFIDQTSGSSADAALEINVVDTSGSSDVTLVDYSVEVTGFETSDAGNASAKGFISDGTDTVNFDFSIDIGAVDSNNERRVQYDLSISVPNHEVDLALVIDVTADASDPDQSSGTVKLTVKSEGNTLVMDMSFKQDDTVSGTVKYNGAKVANIQGDQDTGVSFVDDDGNPLSQEKQLALNQIFFESFLALFFGAFVIFILAGAAFTSV